MINSHENYLMTCKLMEKYNHAYYVLGEPLISDSEYDLLYRDILVYEEYNPELIAKNSPTKQIGSATPDSDLVDVELSVPMKSLDNAFTLEELVKFFLRLLPLKEVDVRDRISLEYKLDGLAYEASFRDGVLVSLATRGDGLTGKCIYRHANQISGIPLSGETRSGLRDFDVHGEIVCSKETFEQLNRHLLSTGQKAFASPRNAAAALIRRKDMGLPEGLKLEAYAYNVDFLDDPVEGFNYVNCVASYSLLDIMETLPLRESTRCKVADIYNDILAVETDIANIPLPIDGMVVKILSENKVLYTDIGSTHKSPNWAIAYKFNDIVYTSHVLEMNWGMGRTGKLTPVIKFEPVMINGVCVENTTCHNASTIEELNIRKGDTVMVKRAGDVIPKLVQVIHTPEGDKHEPFKIPDTCPLCGYKTELINKDVMCQNAYCSSKLIQRINYYVSRPCMDMRHVGPSLVATLFECGYIYYPTDIHNITHEDIVSCGVSPKIAMKVIASIVSAEDRCTLNRFISSLGIPNVGPAVAMVLCEYLDLRNFEDFIQACGDVDKLTNAHGVGLRIAEELHHFATHTDQESEAADELESIREMMIKRSFNPSRESTTGKRHINIAMSGPMILSKSDVQQIMERTENVVMATTVNKKTDILLANADIDTAKVRKARELGIPIVPLEDVIDIVSKEFFSIETMLNWMNK